MSEKELLEELIKQFKKQNEILEKICSEIDDIGENISAQLPDYGTQLDEIQNNLENIDDRLETIGMILSKQK